MMRKQSGFTFIELVICILVLGIIAAAVVPKFYDMQEDAEAETARSVAANIEMAMTQGFSRGYSYNDLVASGGLFDDIINMIEKDYSSDVITITVNSNGNATIDFVKSGRSVDLTVNNQAQVEFSNPSGFNVYSIDATTKDLVK